MSEPVEMRPAYEWTCPECGRDQFAKTMVAEMSPEEKKEIAAEMGIDDWENGDLQTYPEAVTCAFCKREFPTIGFGMEDEE